MSPVLPPRRALETGRHHAPRHQAPRRSVTVLRGGWRPAVLVSVVGLSCLAAPAVATVTPDSGAKMLLAGSQLDQVDLSMRVLDRGSRSADREAPATRMPASPVSPDAGYGADEPEVPHRMLLARPVEVPASAPVAVPVAASTPTPTAAATPAPKATTAKPAPTTAAPTTPAPTKPAPTKAAVSAPVPAAGGISAAPCAGGSAVESGLTPDAIRVHRAVCALFPSVGAYGGRTGSGGEHSTGQAIDIMIPSSGVGSQIAAWVRANAKALGVSEVIWSQHIWTMQRSGEGWRAMSNRGSATANHYDHVHVTVYGNAGG